MSFANVMKPLIVLIGVFILALIVLRASAKQVDFQFAGRIAMAAMLVFTAMGHFAFTKGMAAMIPEFVLFKTSVVYLSGIFEILLALGLLLRNYKTAVGWVVIVFFILMLPANIKAAIINLNYQTGELNGPGLSYLWFRIPLQILFIAWVFLSAIKN